MKKIFKKLSAYLLLIGCIGIFMPVYAGMPNSTACNNFSLLIKNDTSTDIRVHYEVPGDGLHPWVHSPVSYPISGDVDVAKGEAKKIVTVINPIIDSQVENEAPYEGKADSLHDDTWVHVKIYAKKSEARMDLMYDKVIKKNVAKWKFFPTYAPYHKIPGQDMCAIGYQVENVFKVVPERIEYDTGEKKPLFSLYDDVLLGNPPRYYDNRCIYVTGECGVAMFANGEMAKKAEKKKTEEGEKTVLTILEKAGGDYTVSLLDDTTTPKPGVLYLAWESPGKTLKYRVLSSTNHILNGTIGVDNVPGISELKDPLNVKEVENILPDILNYLITYDASWTTKKIYGVDKIESGFTSTVTLQLKDKAN